MFDLDKLDTKTRSEQGVPMPVKTFDGKPYINALGKPIELIVKGPDSADYSRVVREQVKKRVARAGDLTDAQRDEDDADAIGMLVECTVGWNGIVKKPAPPEAEPSPVPFSSEACRKLYTDFPAIRDQVDAFISNRANFTLASSKK